MSSDIEITAGQPPRQAKNAILYRSAFDSAAILVSESVNSCVRLTAPVESPDSYSDMGLILSHANRPVPECFILLRSAGLAEPVRINCPIPFLWSILKRIASQSVGVSCHSSISRGVSPSSKMSGLSSANISYRACFCGLSINMALFEWCSAVVDLPHHLGPSITMAPMLRKRFASSESTIRL